MKKRNRTYKCTVCKSVLSADEAIIINKTPVCRNCYETHIDSIYEDMKKEVSSYLLRIILFTVAYIIGIILLTKVNAAGGPDSDDPTTLIMLLGGVLLCGFFPATLGLRNKNREIAQQEARNGSTYYIYEDGSIEKDRKLGPRILTFVIHCVIGIVTTPIYILILLVNCIKAIKDVTAIKASMRKYR